MAKSAWGNLDIFTGDVASHLFGINVDPNAAQFSEDGKVTMPYLTVQYVCGRCHVQGGGASPRSVDELAEFAEGYHAGP
jgi:hypothetical protein